MSQRMRTSVVFRPGQLQANIRQDDISVACRRCKMHLESGQCSCGIWGYKAPARVQREYLHSTFWTTDYNPESQRGYLEVLCAVRIFGTVLEGQWGYRASNVEIEAMFIPGAEDLEVFCLVDNGTLKPYFAPDYFGSGVEPISWFHTGTSGYATSTYSRKKLDPKMIFKKLSEQYRCQVIPVASGVEHIKLLDKQYPDELLKPAGSEIVYPTPELLDDDDDDLI